ncbi:hypothetical protein PENSPDRAFT_143181 [Peniophora sp. CONT]|nr:hypothetical protein PENSPDRAFT_143181 [Peniophora sp. CONT]
MREVTDLTDFPVELLERVFSYLPDQDPRDIGWLVVTKVCRLWRNIALHQTFRLLQLRLLPERAQRDIVNRVDGLYQPLPIHLTVAEFRLDVTRGHAHEHHWVHTVHLTHLLAKRIKKLHVTLRHHVGRLHEERIEELLGLILLEPTLEELTLALPSPNARRVIELPLVTAGLGGRGLRVIELYGCQLRDQGRWFSSQTSLEVLKATADKPIWRFISDLPIACLNTLHLILPVQSSPLQRREEPIMMPVLRDLSLESTIHDALALLQALQLPSLVSLAIDFSPEVRFNFRTVTIEPLVEWLSGRFGGRMPSTEIDMSCNLHTLITSVSCDAITDRPMHNRNLFINFPSFHFARDSTLANQQAEQYGALLAMLSETIADHGALRVRVKVAKPPRTFYIRGGSVSTHGPLQSVGRVDGSAIERDTSWCKVLLQLHGTTGLQLNARAAPLLLPLRSGTLPLLEELRVDSENDGVLTVADEREDQAESLYLLAQGESDARRGKCAVFLDGVDIKPRTGPEPSESDDREVGGLMSRAEALHL